MRISAGLAKCYGCACHDHQRPHHHGSRHVILAYASCACTRLPTAAGIPRTPGAAVARPMEVAAMARQQCRQLTVSMLSPSADSDCVHCHIDELLHIVIVFMLAY